MTTTLFLGAIVILASIMIQKIASRLKVPMLLGFIGLGMIFGSEGLFSIPFDDFAFAEQICTVGLVVIMFYGGFGTSWKRAKKVAFPSALLASIGVVSTALLTALFCHYALHILWIESLLIGALLSSTDAASVFNILRSQNLALKNHTDSLLEIESGSNDPFAYMLVLICLTLSKQPFEIGSILLLLIQQIGVGFIVGVAIYIIARTFIKLWHFDIAGFNAVYVLAVGFLSYSIAMLLEGNGFLACYITGLMLGNSNLRAKKELVHFFDGLTTLMQMLIFFLLGLLSFPSQLWINLPLAGFVFLFLTLLARPISVFTILSCFKNYSFAQKTLISFAGLRGVASIVFAIMATLHETVFHYDLYHIVFGVVLFSIAIQGTLLPYVAKLLKMSDPAHTILQTFSDYSEQTDLRFIQVRLHKDSHWINRTLESFALPQNLIIALVIRNGRSFIPNKDTLLVKNDILILAGEAYEPSESSLEEETIGKRDPRLNKRLEELYGQIPSILCIKRKDDFFIPTKDTLLLENDTFVYYKAKK